MSWSRWMLYNVVEFFKVFFFFFLSSAFFLALCELFFSCFSSVMSNPIFSISHHWLFFVVFFLLLIFIAIFFRSITPFHLLCFFLCASFKNGLYWCSNFLFAKRRCCLRFYFLNHFYFFLLYHVNLLLLLLFILFFVSCFSLFFNVP
jgi:hypothetical protein